MKRLKISAVLLIIIMLYSTGSLFILKNQNDKLKERVQLVQSAYEEGDTKKALELSNSLNDYWHEYERLVTMIVRDEALSTLNISMAKITPFVSNENAELIAELQSIYHQIDQIYEEEFPCWYNIL
ncbi:MAG: DUF4363 family protein [Oscillospiraceae bacterium]|nr:DUF4363 family protein [Oscillospiraceae bacterium]